MLQAATRDKYLLKLPMAEQMCKQAGFAFSPRLQVLLWNNKRATKKCVILCIKYCSLISNIYFVFIILHMHDFVNNNSSTYLVR